jgi:UDP-N-acetylmuramate dehydrogenase
MPKATIDIVPYCHNAPIMTTIEAGFEKILRRNEPLAPRTWFKLGGSAEYFAEPQSVEELAILVRRCREQELPIRILGSGSNVLVRDEGVRGVVVHLGQTAFDRIHIEGRSVTAGGGALLGDAIAAAVRDGLAGLESLVGIPGTIGGALHNNAGTHAGDVGQWAAHATVLTRSGETIQRERDELVFAYRQSSLDELVILEVRFDLEEEDPVQLTKRMQKQWIVKRASEPAGRTTFGCMFKDPRGMSAAMLIEQVGLKGATEGSAQVSQQNANFAIANEGATATDVLRLIDNVRTAVAERLGIELEKAIEVW